MNTNPEDDPAIAAILKLASGCLKMSIGFMIVAILIGLFMFVLTDNTNELKKLSERIEKITR